MNMQKNIPPTEAYGPMAQGERVFEDEAGFSLIDFLRVIRVRRKIILGTAALVLVLVAVLVTLLTPLYSASAVVMLDERKNSVADAAAVLSGLTTNQATIQNQVQILTSLELAGRVVDKLHLDQDPEFNPSASGWGNVLSYLNPLHWFPANSKTEAEAQGVDLERSKLLHRFLGHLSVSPIGLSTAMDVTFESGSPTEAARIANAVANAYVEDQLQAKFDATQKATDWLSGRIGELSKQAQAADAAVQRFKAEHNISTSTNGQTVVDQQIADINTQLIQAKADLAEKQANYDRLAALARTGRAADAPQVVASPLIGTLRGQEVALAQQIANLSSKFGPRYPKMVDLNAQKDDLDAKIKLEIQRIVDSVRNDTDAAKAHVASLQQSLKDVEAQGAGQNQASVQLTALQSAATSARSMYEAFLGRLNQTEGQQGIQTPDARVISQAEVPQSPSFPRKTLAIGIALPGGLMLGLLLAFAAERLDTGFRTTAQVEDLLGIPVLSTVPEIKTSDKTPVQAADLVIDKPMSSFAESIRGIQLGLTLANVDQKPKVVVVTSSVPGEGKTTMAISLARVAASSGLKVIIVDGDLRRPNVAKALGAPAYEAGLIEALTGSHELDQCIQRDPRSDACVLPCLHTPPSPSDVLAAASMERLVSQLSKAFDLVIIDSAPILPVNDTKILSRMADAMLFVVQWEKTPREAVVSALRSLADVHAPLSGIALARADNARFRYYSYGYQSYYNYSKYYSD